MGLNFGEAFVVLVSIVVVLGIGKLPQVAEAVGQMRRNYSKGLKGEGDINITPHEGAKKPSVASHSTRNDEVEDAEIIE